MLLGVGIALSIRMTLLAVDQHLPGHDRISVARQPSCGPA
jgi:hypothetical protein